LKRPPALAPEADLHEKVSVTELQHLVKTQVCSTSGLMF